jgi:hypothetical protein
MKRYMNYGGRSFAAGGAMPMEQLTEFNGGGRHEENSLGGIPQGMNPDGQMNLVEEGETKFDAENYIYSDSLKIDKELAEAFNLSPKMVGKTFADASKTAGRKKSKREGDAIEMAANEKDLMNLMEAQEAFKQARIEEKLQEIAELDPNALPALMGQGQPQGGPQGDPAMGGQMQEAPMDEQAMMEQQMMAEQQQGGGQPSPEEMAMMEQQQNMAMGQQEGMMRSGGFTDPPSKLGNSNMYYNPVKPVLESMDFNIGTGAGPNMGMNEGLDMTGGVTDELTDMGPAYLQSLQGASNPAPNPTLNTSGFTGMIKNKSGGYINRSYAPGGFMGMNMANAGAMGVSADPKGCPCTRVSGSSAASTVYSPECCGEGFDEQATKGLNYIREKRDGTYKSKGIPKRHIKSLEKYDVNYDEHGEYNRNRVDNGINNVSASQGNFANFDLDLLNEEQKNIVSSPEFRANPTAFRGQLPRGYVRDAKKVKQALDWKPIGEKKWDFNPYDRPDETPNKIPFFNRDDIREFKGELPKTKSHEHDIFSDMFKDGKRSGDGEIQTTWDKMPFKHIRERETEDAEGNTLRRPSNLFLGVKGDTTRRFYLDPFNEEAKFRRQQRRSNRNEFGGSLMQSGQESGINPMQGINQASNMGGMLGGGLAGQNLNLNQGLASQMRKGGKMCYGCGGKMHNYGGRMNQMASGGEIVAGIGSGLYGLGEGLLDTLTFGLTDELTDRGYEKLKSIGPDADGNAGDMIRGGANAAGAIGGAVLTGGAASGAAISEGSEGIGETLGAVGKQTGNDTYTKIGKGVSGAGQVAGMLVGDAGGAAGAADAAGKAGKAVGTSSEMVSKLGVVPEMFETAEMTSNAANAAAKAAKAAEMTSKFNKVGEIAQNDLVQLGVNTGSQAIGASTQNAAQTQAEEFAAEQARIERERRTLQGNKGFVNGGYMGTRFYKGGGRLYNTGGPLTLKKNVTNPDGTTIEQDIVYNSMEELLADTEMVNRYGGKEAVKQAFSDRFKKNKTLTDNIPTAITNPIGTIEDQVLNPAPEENPAMVSYIEQMKAQNMADQQEAIRVAEQPQYMPQVKQLPIMSPGILTMPENNQEMIIPDTPEPILEETDSKVKKSIEGVVNPKLIEDDNEVDVDVDQTDVNRDYSFKESPGQFAAKMAAPMMNLYSGLFDKYDPRFEPEFQKIEAPKLNYTESINSIRRNAAKIKKSFNKVGSNPGNLLAISQQTNSLEAQTIQQIDVINAKLEFEAGKLNNSQKQRLEKTKKELELGFAEAKRKSLQESAKQFQEIATTNQANELAQQYAAMGAENIGKVEYKTLVEQLGELLKKRKENKNKKKK